jgi:DNA-binding MarR family transcriptional regulator
MRQAELARALHLEAPTVSRMLNRMERAGLVERRADRHDGRVIRVVATPRAQLLDAVVRRAALEVEGILDSALGEAGTEALRASLAAATQALTASSARRPG